MTLIFSIILIFLIGTFFSGVGLSLWYFAATIVEVVRAGYLDIYTSLAFIGFLSIIFGTTRWSFNLLRAVTEAQNERMEMLELVSAINAEIENE